MKQWGNQPHPKEEKPLTYDEYVALPSDQYPHIVPRGIITVVLGLRLQVKKTLCSCEHHLKMGGLEQSSLTQATYP